ncbi:MAG TPA: hypothetical protein VJN18_11050 [Polyangiaceae bacterium]|nr:hypothetical protein [Polyangiaceae bacterium]
MAEVYTVRGGIYDVGALSASQIAALYQAELARAGFTAPSLPSVTPRVTLAEPSTEGVFRRITLTAPPFEPVEQSRDTRVSYAEDPAKLAEAGTGQLTTFSWALCGPSDAQAPGALRQVFRSVRLEGTLKLSPVVATWTNTPVELSGFPPRPVQPNCAPRARSSGAAAGIGIGIVALLALGLALKKGA